VSAGRFRPRADAAARAAVVAVAAAAFIWILIRTLDASPRDRVLTIPDDGFYYLTLARNFATQGVWSFDSGVSRTNGFHLLQGYALAALYRAGRFSPDRFVSLAIALSWLAAVPAWILGAVFAWRSRSVVALLMFGVIAISRNALLNSVGVMEWSYVVSLAACYCALLLTATDTPSGIRVGAVALCAFAGSLARTDFGLLPGMLMVVAVGACLLRPSADARKRFGIALVGSIAAAAGVGAVLLHGWLTSGTALQSSARMKLLWMARDVPSWGPIRFKVQELFGPPFTYATTRLLGLLLIGAAAAAVVWLRRQPRDNADASARWLWMGSVLTLAGFVTFYRWDAGVQAWYTGNLVVPVFLTISLPFVYSRSSVWIARAAMAVLLVAGVRQALDLRALPDYPLWPWQVYMYDAGTYLAQHRPDGRVASWNAGIIGYYAGGTVINIDGLVNNDIYPFVAARQLDAYFDRERIAYVVDFNQTVDAIPYRRRNGCDVGGCVERLLPFIVLHRDPDGALILYKVAARSPVL